MALAKSIGNAVAAVLLGRIPDDHLIERYPHLASGVTAQVLIREEEHFAPLGKRPFEGRPCIATGTDDTTPLAAERFQVRR